MRAQDEDVAITFSVPIHLSGWAGGQNIISHLTRGSPWVVSRTKAKPPPHPTLRVAVDGWQGRDDNPRTSMKIHVPRGHTDTGETERSWGSKIDRPSIRRKSHERIIRIYIPRRSNDRQTKIRRLLFNIRPTKIQRKSIETLTNIYRVPTRRKFNEDLSNIYRNCSEHTADETELDRESIEPPPNQDPMNIYRASIEYRSNSNRKSIEPPSDGNPTNICCKSIEDSSKIQRAAIEPPSNENPTNIYRTCARRKFDEHRTNMRQTKSDEYATNLERQKSKLQVFRLRPTSSTNLFSLEASSYFGHGRRSRQNAPSPVVLPSVSM